MAMDKYELLCILKEYLEDDDQCGSDCMECDMADPCERLRTTIGELFSEKKEPVESKSTGKLERFIPIDSDGIRDSGGSSSTGRHLANHE